MYHHLILAVRSEHIIMPHEKDVLWLRLLMYLQIQQETRSLQLSKRVNDVLVRLQP